MADFTQQQVRDVLWEKGVLAWKLLPHQKDIYQFLWNCIGQKEVRRAALNCARRTGKTTILLLIVVEFCLRFPGSQVRYGATTFKELDNTIGRIVRDIIGDCPAHLKPSYSSTKGRLEFPNGSVCLFAGLNNDKADDLRGQMANLALIDEAGFVDDLDYAVTSVLEPQLDTAGVNATLILASTPSRTKEHNFFKLYHECMENGNSFVQTVYDSGHYYTEEERNDWESYGYQFGPVKIAEYASRYTGGEQAPEFKREYGCIFISDRETLLLPDFDKDKHVGVYERDRYYQFYHHYVSIDFGAVRDMTSVIFATYDFRKATLVIEDEYHDVGGHITTDVLADEIKRREKALWGNDEVYRRVADSSDPIIINTLTISHDLPTIRTVKVGPLAMTGEIRVWLRENRIIVPPHLTWAIGSMEHGVWADSQKATFGHSRVYGHYDFIASLMYLVRNVDTFTNPVPHLPFFDASNHNVYDKYQLAGQPQNDAVEQLRKILRPRFIDGPPRKRIR